VPGVAAGGAMSVPIAVGMTVAMAVAPGSGRDLLCD
jgi:hypothetical protein